MTHPIRRSDSSCVDHTLNNAPVDRSLHNPQLSNTLQSAAPSFARLHHLPLTVKILVGILFFPLGIYWLYQYLTGVSPVAKAQEPKSIVHLSQEPLLHFLTMSGYKATDYQSCLQGDLSFLKPVDSLKVVKDHLQLLTAALYECAARGTKGTAQKLFDQLDTHAHFDTSIRQSFIDVLERTKNIELIKERSLRDGFIVFYNKNFTPVTEVFGNFYESDFDGFLTTEGAYQCEKAKEHTPNLSSTIVDAFKRANGNVAFRLGKTYNHPGWHRNNHKVDVMRRVVLKKFRDDIYAKWALLATGTATIIEHNPHKGVDTFWSDDSDKNGQNWLGWILEDVRGGLVNDIVIWSSTPQNRELPQSYWNNAKLSY